MPGMVMPAGIDAAADLELQFAEVALPRRVSEAFGDLLCDRDRTGIGEAAIIEAGTSDDIADQVEIGGGEASGVELLPDRGEIGCADVRQDDVLRVRDAQFVEAVALGEIGHEVDLIGSRVAGDAADRLQADRKDGIARLLVRSSILFAPSLKPTAVRFERSREAGSWRRCLDFARHERGRGVVGLERGRCEHRGDAVELGLGRIEPERLDRDELLLDLTAIFVRADFVEQDLDPRLVNIVAAAVAIVDAQARFEIAEQIVGGDEVADFVADHRGAAHAAADEDLPAEHTVTLQQLNPDIVQPHRRTVFVRRDHRDLELARQVSEFGVEGTPLAQQFRPDARIGDFVRCGPGILVGRDVADAIPRCLDRMHLDLRQFGKDVGGLVELDPIILDVLPRGEMAVAAVVFARDVREHPHLTAVERAVRDRDAQHVRMQLQV